MLLVFAFAASSGRPSKSHWAHRAASTACFVSAELILNHEIITSDESFGSSPDPPRRSAEAHPRGDRVNSLTAAVGAQEIPPRSPQGQLTEVLRKRAGVGPRPPP